MNLKRLIFGLLLTMSVCAGAKAQSAIANEPYFPYPLVPDSIQAFQSRCDYLARHFWDFCELSKAFSARQKMANEFSVYLSILKNASVDSALASVERLAKKLEKQPNDLLFLARQAEAKLYSDTAEAWVDGLYLPFAEAVVKHKKIDKASKSRFAHQATILKNTMMGGPAGPLPYTTREGATRNLSTDSAEVLVVFFNDPDCSDCDMARIRLDADISTTELINEGKVKIVAISLTEPNEEWKKSVANYPASWTVGANPDADLIYDLRSGTPNFYIIDRKHNVRFKHLQIDQMLDVMRQLKKR
ncbi:MAG: DUF5106 domain-containing protein [Muribaculaceae bacterium]|nr:DUF5106 domain-containing protein [Muribaculaceae bacterium]